jgi:hypothetical protein
MLVLAGIALVALIAIVLVAAMERRRAHHGAAQAATTLERARRRAGAHAGWLRGVAHAADDIHGGPATVGDPGVQTSSPTARVQ